MSKIKTFLRALYQSGTNPSYYQDVLKAPLSFSIKYILLLTLFLSIIGTIISSVGAIPVIKSISTEIDKRADSMFPSNLVIEIKDGKLSTNHKGPLTITLPASDGQPNTIIIDPEEKTSDAQKKNAFILAMKEGLSFKSESETRTYSYKEMEIKDVTLDKTLFNKIVSQTKYYLSILPNILPAVIFIGLMIVTTISVFFKAVFYSLITYLVFRIMTFHSTYRKSFQITLHAITPILLLQILEIIFSFIVPIPLFYPILFAILMVIITKELKKDTLKETSRPKKK